MVVCLSCCLKKWKFIYPSALYKWPQFVLAKNLPKGRLLGICIGCTIAKTNTHVCDVGYYVPTSWHLTSKGKLVILLRRLFLVF